jgi:hypothetical protein
LRLALNLHPAQPAGDRQRQSVPEGAEVGDIDAIVQGYPQERLLLTSLYFLAING